MQHICLLINQYFGFSTTVSDKSSEMQNACMWWKQDPDLLLSHWPDVPACIFLTTRGAKQGGLTVSVMEQFAWNLWRHGHCVNVQMITISNWKTKCNAWPVRCRHYRFYLCMGLRSWCCFAACKSASDRWSSTAWDWKAKCASWLTCISTVVTWLEILKAELQMHVSEQGHSWNISYSIVHSKNIWIVQISCSNKGNINYLVELWHIAKNSEHEKKKKLLIYYNL